MYMDDICYLYKKIWSLLLFKNLFLNNNKRMGGGLIQLVAYGIQDIYLTGDPQITFFKTVYKRHTNFTIEPIKQFFNSNPDFGKTVTCTLCRNGDLITNVYIFLKLPFIPKFRNDTSNIKKKFSWVRKIGYALIKQIDIEIGGQLIDTHYGEWLNIWAELTNTHECLADMIGDVPELFTPSNGKQGYGLYIPLEFWFCRHSGLALPVIALQYSEIKIHLELREAEDVYVIYPTHYIEIIDDIVGFEEGEYIEQNIHGIKIGGLFEYFDPLMRRLYYTKIIDNPEKQFIKKNPIIGYKTGLCVFPDPRKTGEVKLKNALPRRRELTIGPSHLLVDYVYLDTKERIKFIETSHEYLIEQLQFSGKKTIYDNYHIEQLSFSHPTKEIVWVTPLVNLTDGFLKDMFNYSNDKDRCNNIVSKATILLNGQERFAPREGNYFNWVQPYERHTRGPEQGIYVYSFAIFPEDKQPSGSCNMSKIDDLKLLLEFDGSVNLMNMVHLRVYAVNYNILRIIHGLGGLAFSA